MTSWIAFKIFLTGAVLFAIAVGLTHDDPTEDRPILIVLTGLLGFALAIVGIIGLIWSL